MGRTCDFHLFEENHRAARVWCQGGNGLETELEAGDGKPGDVVSKEDDRLSRRGIVPRDAVLLEERDSVVDGHGGARD